MFKSDLPENLRAQEKGARVKSFANHFQTALVEVNLVCLVAPFITPMHFHQEDSSTKGERDADIFSNINTLKLQWSRPRGIIFLNVFLKSLCLFFQELLKH